VKQIIGYFDRSYIINLSDRTDRRRQVEREFRRVGVNIPSENVRLYTAIRPTDKAGFMDIGTRGNFTSHKNVLELANRDRLRNVLIFEDDVSFRNVEGAFEQKLLTQLAREDWDVVFFGYLSPPDEGLTGPLMRWPKDILGMHFYAVNGRFIGTMLEYMNECEMRPRDHPLGGPMTADGAYNHIRYVTPNINVFLSVPNLAHQRSSRTDIASTRGFDRIVWLRPFLRSARAVKHQLRMALDKKRLRRQLDKQEPPLDA
jgi:glycosyl transferase family 25